MLILRLQGGPSVLLFCKEVEELAGTAVKAAVKFERESDRCGR